MKVRGFASKDLKNKRAAGWEEEDLRRKREIREVSAVNMTKIDQRGQS